MADILDAIQHINGPLKALAVLAVVLAWVYKRRMSNPAILQLDFDLAKTKLTRERYFQLQQRKGTLVLGGTVVICALFLGAWLLPIYWANQPKTQDVDLYTRYDGQILDSDFVADYHLPNGPGSADGKGGKGVIRGVPAGAAKLDIQGVRENGYKPKPDQEYKIEDGKVIIEMVPSKKLPEHLGGSDMPNVQPYLPTDDEMKESPKISDPKQVLLSLTNHTSDHLKLLLYNCGKPANAVSRWWSQDLPPNVADKHCDNIPTGNGWFIAHVEFPALLFVPRHGKCPRY